MSNLNFIPIFGSYDKVTKELMIDLKNSLIEILSGLNVYIFLLEGLEIFTVKLSSELENLDIVIELFEDEIITAYIFRGNNLMDVKDLEIINNVDDTLYYYLKDKYEIHSMDKIGLIDKYKHILNASNIIIFIREMEKTKGGEYLEFMHAILSDNKNKVYFLYNVGIKLSWMLEEYLIYFNIHTLNYKDKKDLISISRKIVKSKKY